MNNLAKRQVMKKLYIAKKTLECVSKATRAARIHTSLAMPVMRSCRATINTVIWETPASIFRTDRPEIDKRRARRYRGSRTLPKPGVTFTPEQNTHINCGSYGTTATLFVKNMLEMDMGGL